MQSWENKLQENSSLTNTVQSWENKLQENSAMTNTARKSKIYWHLLESEFAGIKLVFTRLFLPLNEK